MSVKMMGLVWDMNLPRAEKFVLLAYADHADHDGRNIFPSQETIATKTGYGRRQINSITQALSSPRGEENGIPARDAILVEDGISKYSTIRWRMDLQACAKIAQVGGEGVQNPHMGVQKTAESSAEIAHEPSFKPSVKTIKKDIPTNPTASKIWTPIYNILESDMKHNRADFLRFIEPVIPILKRKGILYLSVPDEILPEIDSRFKPNINRLLTNGTTCKFIGHSEEPHLELE